MDSLLIVLAALAPETFFDHSYPVGSWTKWQVSGEVKLQFVRTRGPSTEGYLWVVHMEDKKLEILLSPDRLDMISAIQVHPSGEKTPIPGAGMWYSPLQSSSPEERSKSIVSSSKKEETAIGRLDCTRAMFVDNEGNAFRWTLSDDVIGGVVQYEVVFDGTPKRRLTYTLLEHRK